MMKWFLIPALAVIVTSCTQNNKLSNFEKPEDTKAKQLLQGIWLDCDSEVPLMNIKGDTIYHSDPQNVPVYFKIIKDSLYTFGNTTTSYHIDRQTEYSFWFHSLSGNIIKLSKSENSEDSIAFSGRTLEIIPTYSETTQKDSIVFYNSTRYRAYVYINPSKMRVTKTIYSDEGLGVENIYYDNIIHICVYKGGEKVYAKDITKQMFDKVISTDFLSNAILADINFINISPSGFLYQANICVPESYVCQLVNLRVSFDGKLNIISSEEDLFAEIK